MKRIYVTEEGEYGDFGWLAYEFIKAIDKTEEFEVFKSTLVKDEIEYHS